MNYNRLCAILFMCWLCLGATTAQAQRQYENWYFGTNTAFNFNAGTAPVEVANASQITGVVSTTISDAATGQLLFYTDGITVWNRNNTVMDNGSSILSTPVCSHVTSCPNPVKAGQHYVFMHNNGQLRYALIDMTENGGLGKVISTDNLLAPAIANKFAIARHGTTDSYWLITFRGSNGNDTFECYPITNAGIQAPVRSIMGFHNGITTLGDLVTNRSGDKIFISFNSPTTAAINQYSFSKTCGTVGTPRNLPIGTGWNNAKSIAFSPSNLQMYAIFGQSQGRVVQYSGADFQSSQEIANSVQAYNDIKLGPDGKIYITKNVAGNPSGSIDVIEKPDLFSLAAAYMTNNITLSGGKTAVRFPIIMYDVSTPGNTVITTKIDVKNTCYKDTTVFTPSNMPFLDSLLWDFADPASATNTSTKDIPSHTFSDTGTYNVSLSWFLCGLKYSIFKEVTIITPPKVNLGTDTTLCFENSITLKGPKGNFDYTWSTGSKDTMLLVDTAGTYSLRISIGPKCAESDTIAISYYPKLEVDFFDSTYFLCEEEGETLNLNAASGFATYLWEPGLTTNATHTATKTGWYKVYVTNTSGCEAQDSVEIFTLCDNWLLMPEAFSPNNDLLNDTFAPVFSEVFNFGIEIYNRWGEKVFESNDPKKGWDGTYKNAFLPTDTYLWKLRYQGYNDKILRTYTKNGVVKLIR
ncbi:MAG: gliding motility-associated C-terminal domain-containing protein [Bacteroidota bacterium]